MEKIDILRKELEKLTPSEQIDYLSDYIKDQIMFSTKIQFRELVDKILVLADEFDRDTELAAVGCLEDLGFEIVKARK